MTDVHNKETRSYNMSRIISENTKPEMIVRKYLHAKGLRYRLHTKELPENRIFIFQNIKQLSKSEVVFGMVMKTANTL